MARSRGASFMIESIRRTVNAFYCMNSEERIKFINKYNLLMPYEKTALLQCKKFMNTAEKRAYKAVQEKLKSVAQNEPPQPM